MHILALNSSPRDNETSKTALVLQKFLEGAKRAGASTETLYLRDYKDQTLPGMLWVLGPDAGSLRPKRRHDGSCFCLTSICRPTWWCSGQPHLSCHHECPDEAVRGAPCP